MNKIYQIVFAVLIICGIATTTEITNDGKYVFIFSEGNISIDRLGLHDAAIIQAQFNNQHDVNLSSEYPYNIGNLSNGTITIKKHDGIVFNVYTISKLMNLTIHL